MAELAYKITSESNREEWLKARKSGLGGSDMPAIMGVSPWKTALDVYLEKTQDLPAETETPAMRRGTVLEPIAADEYQRATGKKLQRGHAGLPVGILRHSEHPWAQANLDRVVMGTKTLAEIKVPGLSAFSKIKTQGVSPTYQIQGQHYLFVTGLDAVLFIIFNAERWEFLEVTVERDPDIIEMIQEAGHNFWENNIKAGRPPEIDRPPALPDLPPAKIGEIITMDSPEWAEAAELLVDARQIIEGGKALEDQGKASLQDLMDQAGAQVAEGAGLRIHWKEQAGRKSLDKKALQAAHPEINLNQFMKQGKPFKSFRPFVLKGGSDE